MIKPFILAEAIEGKPMVTRCGYPVKLLWYEKDFFHQIQVGYKILSPIHDGPVDCDERGICHKPGFGCKFDLFMVIDDNETTKNSQ